jgi:hypothetical protein
MNPKTTPSTTSAAQPNSKLSIVKPASVFEQAEAKQDKPKKRCSHTDGKGRQCQLYVIEGSDRCSNHQDAERKLTADELNLLAGYLTSLDAKALTVLVVREIGWYAARQLANELKTVGKRAA